MSGGICLLLVSSAANDATCMILQWLSVVAYVSILCSRAMQGYLHTAIQVSHATYLVTSLTHVLSYIMHIGQLTLFRQHTMSIPWLPLRQTESEGIILQAFSEHLCGGVCVSSCASSWLSCLCFLMTSSLKSF